jgi:c-di-GMP-binding flagellar brake protein YcgR
MAESEKIKGAAIPKLFEDLLHHQTLLKLTVVDTDDAHLTLVTELADRNQDPYFAIDIPEGFEQANAAIDIRHLHFEFTGQDNIKYTFRCTRAEVEDNRIFVEYPRVITRWQRRELFRLNAPAGTKLCLRQGELRYELDVIDISIGGTLAALVRTASGQLEKPTFAGTRILKDIELLVPAELMRQPIRIKAVKLRRLIQNSENTGYEIAFEFLEIDAGEQKRLTKLIYRLQRQALRQRLPVDL